MSSYQLTRSVLDEIDQILFGLAEYGGWERSMRFEERLFKAFERLGNVPGLGHRRDEWKRPDLRFYSLDPYLIVYRPAQPLVIEAVFHGSRDLGRLLATL